MSLKPHVKLFKPHFKKSNNPKWSPGKQTVWRRVECNIHNYTTEIYHNSSDTDLIIGEEVIQLEGGADTPSYVRRLLPGGQGILVRQSARKLLQMRSATNRQLRVLTFLKRRWRDKQNEGENC